MAEHNVNIFEERYRIATESIEGMMYECDYNNHSVMRSVGFENLTSLQTSEVPKTMSCWVENIHHEDLANYESTLNDAVTRTLESVTVDYRLCYAAMGCIEVRDCYRIRYSQDGTPIQIIGCVSRIHPAPFDELHLTDSDRPCISKIPIKQNRTALRVLIVDDYPSAADSLGKLLRLLGHEADVAYGGDRALQLANENAYDVFFLDIELPGISGYDVAQQIRTRRQDDVMIVALSGCGDAQSRTRSTEAGFSYHYTKPISHSDLDHLLQAALRKKVSSDFWGMGLKKRTN